MSGSNLSDLEQYLGVFNMSAWENLQAISASQDGQMTSELQLLSLKQSWLPHDYQKTGIVHLLSTAGAALFLDPGLGKTSISLATYSILRREGIAKKALVVVPLMPMISSWGGEIEKWAEFNDITYTILHGKNKVWNLALDVDLYLINPEGLLWLFERGCPDWDIIIVDESTKFKHTNTKRFGLLRKNMWRFERAWILTGTPVPNGLLDLFGQMFIIDGGASLGRYITNYKEKWFHAPNPMNPYKYVPNKGAFEEIMEAVKPYVYQISAADYLKLPELIYVDRELELPERVRKVYDDLHDEFIHELSEEKVITVANAAIAGQKCKQLCNGAMYDTPGEDGKKPILWFHDLKLDAMESLLEELDGHPVLLLYEYVHDRERILARLQDIEDPSNVRVLGGGTSAKSVEKIVSEFNAGTVTRLVGHPESMGFGLNLQGACHHVIWFGIPWRLDLYIQTIARVFRQGQKASHVFVYHLLIKDSVDTDAITALRQKNATQEQVLQALAHAK